ncbi:MAG: hypothetical protein WC538_22050 [Thermoanaerobaculia bacterium]
MRRKRKVRRARQVDESRCVERIKYPHYIAPGYRSDRHGRCHHWTTMTCGRCRSHCVKFCSSPVSHLLHRPTWMLLTWRRKEGGTK